VGRLRGRGVPRSLNVTLNTPTPAEVKKGFPALRSLSYINFYTISLS